MQITSKSKKSLPIGVFDSGVGGLSILIELKKLLPKENFVFLADQAYVPYGEKTKRQLVARCFKVTDYLVKNHNIKMMVVACNTATCGAIDELREKYSFPVVGTLPAVKVGSKLTKSGEIAVISTPSTSKSVALKNLIKDNCKGLKVLNIGCKNLEDVVEKGKLDSRETHKLLLKYLEAVKNSDVDYLVLGCTHYPFLRPQIQKIIGRGITLLDGANAISKRTKWWLDTHHMKSRASTGGQTSYFTTKDSAKFTKVASILLKKKISSKRVAI